MTPTDATTWTMVSDQLPPDGQLVETKIEDEGGVRNRQPLVRHGSLWFLKGGVMYVYYTPTHWRPVEGGGV